MKVEYLGFEIEFKPTSNLIFPIYNIKSTFSYFANLFNKTSLFNNFELVFFLHFGDGI